MFDAYTNEVRGFDANGYIYSGLPYVGGAEGSLIALNQQRQQQQQQCNAEPSNLISSTGHVSPKGQPEEDGDDGDAQGKRRRVQRACDVSTDPNECLSWLRSAAVESLADVQETPHVSVGLSSQKNQVRWLTARETRLHKLHNLWSRVQV